MGHSYRTSLDVPISRVMVLPVFLAVAAVFVSVPAVWIWGWPAARWNRLYEWETGPGWHGYPFSAVSSTPALALAIWLAAGFAFVLTLTVPEDAPSWSDAAFIAAVVGPLALPSLVYLFHVPASLIPPAGRQIATADRGPSVPKSGEEVPPWIDNSILVLSGFVSIDAYRDRHAAWEPDRTFHSVEEAERAAKNWLATQKAEAQVEVIRVMEPASRVIAVVTRAGVESIDS